MLPERLQHEKGDVGILCVRGKKKKKGHQGTPPQLMRNDCSLPTGNRATLSNIFQSNKDADATH